MIGEACDKCGGYVPEDNDAGIIDAEFRGIPAYLNTSRHFLLVSKDGMRVCEGSPSRAQYIEGQPRDTRRYPYLEKYERPMRAAYQKVLEFVRGKGN